MRHKLVNGVVSFRLSEADAPSRWTPKENVDGNTVFTTRYDLSGDALRRVLVLDRPGRRASATAKSAGADLQHRQAETPRRPAACRRHGLFSGLQHLLRDGQRRI